MAEQGGACVVDQHADAGVVTQPRLDFFEVGGVGQVGLQHVDGDAGFGPQALGQRFEAGDVARHQHEVVAAVGEAVGVGRADAAGGAGDKDGGEVAHVLAPIHDIHHDCANMMIIIYVVK